MLPAIPLPAFRQPHRDRLDELPESSPPSSPGEPASPPASPPASSPDDVPPPPIVSSPDRPAAARTRTSGTEVGKTLGGLLVIVVGFTAALLARRGRALRQPRPSQVDDIAMPLGRIAARHLPVDMIGPDLADVTESAAALHRYLLDDAGPLITRTASAAVDYPSED